MADDERDVKPEPEPAGARFELFPSDDGWRWRLKARNGEIVAQSEGYETRSAALEGAVTAKRIAGDAVIA